MQPVRMNETRARIRAADEIKVWHRGEATATEAKEAEEIEEIEEIEEVEEAEEVEELEDSRRTEMKLE
jgi:hypothetical protein